MTPTTRPRWLAGTLVVALLLPLLAAAALSWTTTSRLDSAQSVPVAVVNEDEIVQEPQPMAAGRELAAELVEPSEETETPLDWHLADADSARQGLRDGDYYAVLTIPEDFSRSVLSSGTDDPERARLDLRTDDASSITVSQASEAVVDASARALGEEVTAAYLDQVYVGLNEAGEGMAQAADGAVSLHDATEDVADGTGQVAGSADQLADGLVDLGAGAGELAGAADSVATGVDGTAAGAADLAAGADRLRDGTEQLADGADRLAGGVDELHTNAASLAGRTAELVGGADQARAAAGQVADGAASTAGGSQELAAGLHALGDLCLASGAAPAYCEQVAAAAASAGELAAGAGEVSAGATGVAEATGAVAEGVRGVSEGTAGIADGAGRLATASRDLADGAAGSAAGAADLAEGAGALASGTRQLADGAGRLANGTDDLAAGASASADGSRRLADGSADLAAGSQEVATGAGELGAQLEEGAAQAPSYDADERAELSRVVSQPVVVEASARHDDAGTGWFAAAIAGAVLWLSALVGLVLHRRRRDTDRLPVSDRRLARRQLLPVVGVAALQALVVVGTVLVAGLSVAQPLLFGALTVLGAASFVLLAQGLGSRFGRVGLALVVLLLVVQVASWGNVIPLETAPALLQALAGVLPLTVFVDAAGALATGAATSSDLGAAAVLAAWALLGVVLTRAGLRRDRLRPAGSGS